MRPEDTISDEILNAFIDNELEANERAQILKRLEQDQELAAKYSELCQIKERMLLAYSEIPQPRARRKEYLPGLRVSYAQAAIVVATLLISGGFTGWVVHGQKQLLENTQIQSIEKINLKNLGINKVLFHINSDDSSRIEAVLRKAKVFLHNDKNVQIEIVANASGLSMLRAGSPYTREIRSMSEKYDNVKFLACGVAKQNATLKEGRTIKLLKDAKEIPAALDEILTRIEAGWLYVKG